MKSFLKNILYPEKIVFKKLNMKEKALLIYIILGGIFISCLIACNLIFLKFFSIEIITKIMKRFEIITTYFIYESIELLCKPEV